MFQTVSYQLRIISVSEKIENVEQVVLLVYVKSDVVCNQRKDLGVDNFESI